MERFEGWKKRCDRVVRGRGGAKCSGGWDEACEGARV